MNRRKFLTNLSIVSAISTVSVSATESKLKLPSYYHPTLKYDRRNYLEGGDYYCSHTLFSPEEIVEAGFVFVPYPSCIHRFDDPYHPILKSYCSGEDTNLRPIVMKTHRCCGICYWKDYDPVDSPRWRGIEGVSDYFIKKDIFKPAIIMWMKQMEFHYVYKVLLEASPAFYEEKEISKKIGRPHYCYRHAVNVRGARLPKLS